MTRETENALLLLVGMSTAIITVTGAYTRYVKPSLQPWLAVSAVVLIVLALTAMVRDIRRSRHDRADADADADEEHGDHEHRRGVGWLLVVPVALLAFIVPPAISPQAGGPSVTEVSTEVLKRPFPALPAGRAPEVSLPELLTRVAQDNAGTLDGRLITVTGFAMKDGDRTDLARVTILCCAADARLARVHVDGPAASDFTALPDNTWVRVEGEVPARQDDSSRRTIPVFNVSAVQRIDPPQQPYAF